MDMENEGEQNQNQDLGSLNDPRLELFMQKFGEFQQKLDEYEKAKVEAEKEKDLWYEKSVQLEKQMKAGKHLNGGGLKKQQPPQRKKIGQNQYNPQVISESESSYEGNSQSSSKKSGTTSH